MRVLIDEQLPDQLAAELIGHDVRSVGQMGWKGLANGALLARASEQFDALLSMDRNMPAQQDISRYALGLVLIRATSNRIETLRTLIPDIQRALAAVRPGTVERVGA